MEYLIMKSANQTIVHTHIYGYIRKRLLNELRFLDLNFESGEQYRSGPNYRSSLNLIQLLDIFLCNNYNIISIGSSPKEISRYQNHVINVVTLVRKVDPRCFPAKIDIGADEPESGHQEEEKEKEEEKDEEEEKEEDTPKDEIAKEPEKNEDDELNKDVEEFKGILISARPKHHDTKKRLKIKFSDKIHVKRT